MLTDDNQTLNFSNITRKSLTSTEKKESFNSCKSYVSETKDWVYSFISVLNKLSYK